MYISPLLTANIFGNIFRNLNAVFRASLIFQKIFQILPLAVTGYKGYA